MIASVYSLTEIAWFVGSLAVTVVVCSVLHYLLFKVFSKVARRTPTQLDESMIKHFRGPTFWVFILLGVRTILPLFELSPEMHTTSAQVFSLALIGVVSWLIVRSTNVLYDYVAGRFDVDAKDNLRARKVHTQMRVLRRIVIIVVCVLGLSAALMTFEKVRHLGTTLLASAGVIGIVVGMAAQRTIGTFIAGLQIAFTQPIRLDDVVIVENEWGRIEEITLTYVVVKIWDLRRLVVPITYFIEKPFQNWTRVGADLLGTVYIYVDYTVPFEAVRKQLRRIAEDSELWDKKVCVLQVTNATERTVELRALVSAADASAAWTLRCEVREKLIEFINEKYPKSLPKVRGELDRADAPTPTGQ